MDKAEILKNIIDKKIKNGTIFNVLENGKSIGRIGVIESTITYLNFKQIPEDVLTNDKYVFEEIKEGK
ncbi:MAG: hypothetical protein RR662_07165 [Clostridia bacterium]